MQIVYKPVVTLPRRNTQKRKNQIKHTMIDVALTRSSRTQSTTINNNNK